MLIKINIDKYYKNNCYKLLLKIFNLILFSLQSNKQKNEEQIMNGLNLFEELELFEDKLYKYIKYYEIELKNNFISYFKDNETIRQFYNNFIKQHDSNTAFMKLKKIVPFETIKNDQKNKIIIEKPNLNFLKKYNKELIKESKIALSIYSLIKNLEDINQKIYRNILFQIFKKFHHEKINFENYSNEINDIYYQDTYFFHELYKFERKMLSNQLKVSAFAAINPIHEFILHTEKEVGSKTYVDMLIEKLNFYSKPEWIVQTSYNIKCKNSNVIDYFDDFMQNYDFYCKSFKEYFMYKKISSKGNIFLLFFEKAYFKMPDQYKSNYKNIEKNIPQDFKCFNSSMEKIFNDFCKKHKELENNCKEKIKTILLLNGFDINTSTVAERKVKLEQFQIILECLKFAVYQYNRQFDFGIRNQLIKLIEKLEDHKVKNLLVGEQRVSMNPTTLNTYNNNLKNQYIKFCKDVIFKSDFVFFSEKCSTQIISNTQDYLPFNINLLKHYLTDIQRIQRKKDIFIQIASLFTDFVRKKECLIEIFEFAKNRNQREIDNKTISIDNFSDDISFEEKNVIKKLTILYFDEETKCIDEIIIWLEEEIKNTQKTIEESNKKNDRNHINSPEEEKKTNSFSWKLIGIIGIAIVTVLGIFFLILYKLKSEIHL